MTMLEEALIFCLTHIGQAGEPHVFREAERLKIELAKEINMRQRQRFGFDPEEVANSLRLAMQSGHSINEEIRRIVEPS